MRHGDMVKIVNCKNRCWNGRYGIIVDSHKFRDGLYLKLKVAGLNNISKRFPHWNDEPSGYAWKHVNDVVIVKTSTVWKRAKKIDRMKLRNDVVMLMCNIYGMKQVVKTGNVWATVIFGGLLSLVWLYTIYTGYYKKLVGI